MPPAPEVIDLTQDSDDDDVRLKIKIRSEDIIELTDSEEEDEEKEKLDDEFEYDKGKEMDEEDEEEEEEELEENQKEEIDGEGNDNEENETDSILCDAHLSEADVHRMIYEAIEAMNPATAPGVVNERRGITGEGPNVTRRVNRNMKITLEEPLGPPSSPSDTSRKVYITACRGCLEIFLGF